MKKRQNWKIKSLKLKQTHGNTTRWNVSTSEEAMVNIRSHAPPWRQNNNRTWKLLTEGQLSHFGGGPWTSHQVWTIKWKHVLFCLLFGFRYVHSSKTRCELLFSLRKILNIFYITGEQPNVKVTVSMLTAREHQQKALHATNRLQCCSNAGARHGSLPAEHLRTGSNGPPVHIHRSWTGGSRFWNLTFVQTGDAD